MTDREIGTAWRDYESGADRVRAVALTITEGKNAGWIADEAAVARSSAVRYLERMVDSGELVAIERGRETVYRPDPVTQYFTELRRLITSNTPGELTTELEAIANEIADWRDEYGVESSAELRGTLGDPDLDDRERSERKRVIEDWEYVRHQRDLIRQALDQYDRVERLGANASETVRRTARP